MRVFLDANILFSAVKTDGAIRQLVELLLEAKHDLVADAYVVEEARRNLQAKAPDSAVALAALLKRVRVEAFQPFDGDQETIRLVPEKDRPVVASAIRLGCDVLVTGDRTHFGSLYGRRAGGVQVLSPRLLAEMLMR